MTYRRLICRMKEERKLWWRLIMPGRIQSEPLGIGDPRQPGGREKHRGNVVHYRWIAS